MKKILILSYFFPPCNLTASQRSLGWARYLNRFGYYPIVVTRNWDRPIAAPEDMHHNSGEALIHQQHEGYEVWYVPFKGNLRDKVYARYGQSRFRILRKLLSFFELIAHHFTTSVIPFRHLHYFADRYLQQNKDIKSLIVTGNPFEIFRFGYLLHKKHGIPWIADYRDDWNTSEVNASRGWADSLLRFLERRSERKYIASAWCITTVSPFYAKKIGAFVNKPGKVILNGFVESDFLPFRNQPYAEHFTIVYNGMLYPSQKIEVFLNAFKKLLAKYPSERSRLRLLFPGILFMKEAAAHVLEQMKGYEDILLATDRIERTEVLKLQASAHLLLMVAHSGKKGIPSSKIYEYLALGKPVLVCPGDEDILDETFKPYSIGFIASNENEAFNILERLFLQYLHNEYDSLKPDWNYTAKFSREIQAGNLAKLLNELNLFT